MTALKLPQKGACGEIGEIPCCKCLQFFLRIYIDLASFLPLWQDKAHICLTSFID